MLDVVVVGAGPAGLAAAHVCRSWGLDTLLISEYLGGRTNFHLKLPFLESDDFIGGSHLALQLREQIRLVALPHLSGRVDRVELCDGGVRLEGMGFSPVDSRLGIIATGARPERLDVPGEREFIMRGVAYSSGWYAPLFSDRTVAVVGPGLRAIQGARHLARFARQVFVITPSASGPIWEREPILQATNVSLMSGWRVVSILGTDYVKQVKLERQGAEKTLDVDGVFVCAGISPNSSCVAPLVELTPGGAIKVDGAQRTSQPCLLAAGDVTDPLGEQILVALGAGAKAGISAWETRMSEGGRVTYSGRPSFQRSLDGLRGHMHNGH